MATISTYHMATISTYQADAALLRRMGMTRWRCRDKDTLKEDVDIVRSVLKAAYYIRLDDHGSALLLERREIPGRVFTRVIIIEPDGAFHIWRYAAHYMSQALLRFTQGVCSSMSPPTAEYVPRLPPSLVDCLIKESPRYEYQLRES